MNAGKKVLRLLTWLGVILGQVVMTQLVTLLATLFLPYQEDFPQANPTLFVIVLGISYGTGVFLAGGLALRFRWLPLTPRYPARLTGALIGAYVSLIAALIIYPTLEAGNPFFFIAILTSLLGFYLPGWLKGSQMPASTT